MDNDNIGLVRREPCVNHPIIHSSRQITIKPSIYLFIQTDHHQTIQLSNHPDKLPSNHPIIHSSRQITIKPSQHPAIHTNYHQAINIIHSSRQITIKPSNYPFIQTDYHQTIHSSRQITINHHNIQPSTQITFQLFIHPDRLPLKPSQHPAIQTNYHQAIQLHFTSTDYQSNHPNIQPSRQITIKPS